ncbi:MAG: pyridoxamine 5'-phosphate oxidase family protein [Saprospiraceae bacterium]|nr:pyridoxamine 5'-phosphate oxidase family protein [Saprospiraceae bacterium]
MGKFFESIQPAHRTFIEKQHLFFVSTAPLQANGHINLSPKGLDAFRVLSANQVAYLDLVGSGNETSAHTLENGRITFMFCSFEGPPLILRLYGKGRAVLPGSASWEEYAAHFSPPSNRRQIFVADIDLVQTSCGFGVPLFDYAGERTILADWGSKKGEDALQEYILEKNAVSLDGLKTDYGARIGEGS